MTAALPQEMAGSAAAPSRDIDGTPTALKLHSFFCSLWPLSPITPRHSKVQLIFLLPEGWEKKNTWWQTTDFCFVFCLCVTFLEDESSLSPQRSQCDSSDRHLHTQYQKYQKEMLIKILLSSAEALYLCFWRPFVCYHCSVFSAVVKTGIKTTQN